MELGATPEDRAVLRLLSAPSQIGRPIYTTPGVPEDRVKALRDAFEATMKDAAFLEDAKKAGLDIDPVSGAELQQVVQEIVDTPEAVAKRLAVIIVEGKEACHVGFVEGL